MDTSTTAKVSQTTKLALKSPVNIKLFSTLMLLSLVALIASILRVFIRLSPKDIPVAAITCASIFLAEHASSLQKSIDSTQLKFFNTRAAESSLFLFIFCFFKYFCTLFFHGRAIFQNFFIVFFYQQSNKNTN